MAVYKIGTGPGSDYATLTAMVDYIFATSGEQFYDGDIFELTSNIQDEFVLDYRITDSIIGDPAAKLYIDGKGFEWYNNGNNHTLEVQGGFNHQLFISDITIDNNSSEHSTIYHRTTSNIQLLEFTNCTLKRSYAIVNGNDVDDCIFYSDTFGNVKFTFNRCYFIGNANTSAAVKIITTTAGTSYILNSKITNCVTGISTSFSNSLNDPIISVYNTTIWGCTTGINTNARDSFINTVVVDCTTDVILGPQSLADNFNYCAFEDTYSPTIDWTDNNNILGIDPVASFIDYTVDNMELKSGSTLIDSGDNSVLTAVKPVLVDYDNINRYQGSAIDIGAYEYNANALIDSPKSTIEFLPKSATVTAVKTIYQPGDPGYILVPNNNIEVLSLSAYVKTNFEKSIDNDRLINLRDMLPTAYDDTDVSDFMGFFEDFLNNEIFTHKTDGELTKGEISILKKIELLYTLRDPDLIDSEYIQFFANQLGYDISYGRDDIKGLTGDESEKDINGYLRQTISSLPHWYGFKSTNSAITMLMYSFGIVSDVLTLWTSTYSNNYSEWYEESPNFEDDINKPHIPNNNYYPTPHFKVAVNTNRTPVGWEDNLDNIINLINDIKPINTVFEGFIARLIASPNLDSGFDSIESHSTVLINRNKEYTTTMLNNQTL